MANKVFDALSRRNVAIQEAKLESASLPTLKDMYINDEYYKEAYQVYLELGDRYHTNFTKYLIQEEILFIGSQLYIPQ